MIAAWNSMVRAYDDLAERVAAVQPMTWIGLCTAVVLILNAHSWAYGILGGLFLATITFVPGLRANPLFWLLMAASWLPRLWFRWFENEDHLFFGAYWCLAVSIALTGKDYARLLSGSARLLIGLCFGFAFVWKCIIPDFYDGSLFHYKLVQDYRFQQAVTCPLGGLSDANKKANSDSFFGLRSSTNASDRLPLEYPETVSSIALVMTWWTLFIEGLLAVLFLPWFWKRLDSVRNGTLLLFTLTTYTIVPVLGFGNLFMTMGFAQCEPTQKRTRLAYLLAFAGIYVFSGYRPYLVQLLA